MSGLEPLLIAGVVAGGVTQAVGSSMAGRETSRAAEFERQQLEIQSQTAKTAAAQSEARSREELTSNLETIQVMRAGRGVGATSPTGTAILTSAIEDQERDIAIERANYAQKADLSRRASLMAGRKARTSLLAGDLGAAGAIANIGTNAYSVYRRSA